MKPHRPACVDGEYRSGRCTGCGRTERGHRTADAQRPVPGQRHHPRCPTYPGKPLARGSICADCIYGARA